MYDWSACHDKMATDAAHAKKFLKDPGFQKYGKNVKSKEDPTKILHKKGEEKEFCCVEYLGVNVENYPNKAAGGWLDGGKQYFKFKDGEVPISGAKKDTNYSGVPKGLKQLLQELGLYDSDMKRKVDGDGDKEKCMTSVFMAQPHIDNQKCILEEVTASLGHTVLMLPKFHCELNPMERRWGRAKYYTRRHCNSTMPKLREVILDALGTQNIDHEMSFRFERKSIDYADAYFSGDASDPIVAKVFLRGKKEYRSHRGIPPSEYTGQVAKPWSKKRRKKS